jgi:drug/metabolite transporter (DMT)-like permease
MAIFLGLLVAVLIGAADFLGGFTSRRSSTGSVVFTSQSASLVVSAVAVIVVGGSVAPAHDLLLGIGIGFATITGISALYRGLAGGRMSVVASISAVGGAVIPEAWGLAHGEQPGVLALVGAAVAVGAVVLVARPAAVDQRAGPTLRVPVELAYSVIAAVGFGIATTMFSEVGSGGGPWTVLTARLVTVPVAFVVVVLGARAHRTGPRALLPHRGDLPFVVAGGCLEATANLVLVFAFRDNLTSVVAPVVAVYPAITVLLARVVLGEHLGRIRMLGLAVTLLGLVLIAAG